MGAEVIIDVTASCGGGVQAIRVYVEDALIAEVPGGEASVPWTATGAAGPRAMVVEAAEVGDTGWSNPVRASMSLDVSPPPEEPAPAPEPEAPPLEEETGPTGLFAIVPPVEESPEERELTPCIEQEDAHDIVRADTMASLWRLEILRNMHAALDLQHEDLRQNIYTGLVVDLAAMVPGWPLGAGVADRIFGDAAKGLWKDLANAGLKSMQVQSLKDPSADALINTLTTVDVFEGMASDLSAETFKWALTQKAGETTGNIFGTAWDTLKLMRSGYQGWDQLEASRDMLRVVNERILEAEQAHVGLMEMLDHSSNAVQLCHEGVSHADNWRWQEVRGYLSLPEATSALPHLPPPPTSAEPYYAFILKGIGPVLATEREVRETPSCRWRGGGLDCSVPAAEESRLGGPYDNSQQAIEDLKNRLECFRGYWGDFIKIGDNHHYLQNNIRLDYCKSVTSL